MEPHNLEPLNDVAPQPEEKQLNADTNVEESPRQNNKETATLDKTGVLEALKEILGRDGKDIVREEVSRLKQHFFNLRRGEVEQEKQAHIEAGGNEGDFLAAPDAAEQEMLAIVTDIKQKKTNWIAERDLLLKRNLEKKESIIEVIISLAEDTDNVNRSYTRFKELTQEFKESGDVPQENASAVWKKFQEAEQRFYDQLKINQELRDYDFRKNLEAKQELIKKAEELAADFEEVVKDTSEAIAETEKSDTVESADKPQAEEKAETEEKADSTAEESGKKTDIISAFKQLQDLHEKWKITGPVAKELRDELWQKFQKATVVINKAYQSFFEERKAGEKANEEAKTLLCHKIEEINTESIKTVKDWEKTTALVIDLQNQWKSIGFASRKANNELYARFRKACDDFFTKKGEFFADLKAVQASNLAKKTQLVEQAEALQDNDDWAKTAAELTRLQIEWKKTGAVPRRQSDALWTRFHNACDHFFSRKKEAQGNTRQEERQNLQIKEEILSQLGELTKADDVQTVKEQLAELQKKWRDTGFVPFRDKNRINDAYREAVNKLRSQFNLAETKASFERFKSTVEDMDGDQHKLNRERERLYRILESKRNDLATYQNNMGFLSLSSKSKNGNGLLKEIEHKIELIKSDIADLEQRINLIDSRLA